MGVLRAIFGPSKNEIWSQLSKEIGAEFQTETFFKSGKVVLKHRQWLITLDSYVVNTGKTQARLTRIRAPYVNPEGFRFNIYRKTIFSWLGKLFGMEDITTGDPYFDEEFIIQSTSAETVRRLLLNSQIRTLIKRQTDIRFQVKDDESWFSQTFPEGVDELYFEASGEIKDIDQLKELFELFSAVLDELCRLGVAYEKEPDVIL